MKDITRKYISGDLTVVWKPAQCIHSGICFRGLPVVFDPRKRPWITPEASDNETIMNQIDRCPSGALSYYRNEEHSVQVNAETIAEITPNGPLIVYGNIKVKHADGVEEVKNKVTAFCRCGSSSNKPYCDGTHNKIGFKG